MMRTETSQEAVTLLDILLDGFEKNEVMDGFHWRNLPMPVTKRSKVRLARRRSAALEGLPGEPDTVS